MNKRTREEKYDGVFRIPDPVVMEPSVEFTNDKMEFKINAPMIIFKNLNSNKWKNIIEQFIGNIDTTITKKCSSENKLKYVLNSYFDESTVRFVIDYLSSINSVYDKKILQEKWLLIYSLGRLWEINDICCLVKKYCLGTLMDYNFTNEKPKNIKIDSELLRDSGISFVGYEIYKGLLIEDLKLINDKFNPICDGIYFPSKKIVRAGSFKCDVLINDLIQMRNKTDEHKQAIDLLIGFLVYINKTYIDVYGNKLLTYYLKLSNT